MGDNLVEVRFEDQYTYGKNILSKEQLDLLSAVCSREVKFQQMSKKHKDDEKMSYWEEEEKNHPDLQILIDEYYIGGYTNIAPLNRLLALGLPIEFKIMNSIKEIPEYKVEETILHKLISLEEKLNHFDQAAQFNTKVGVHISDLGLLSVKEVTWLEDACTENLQDHLDNGWRILAVCPQPNSRRPDYVLGKNNS